MPSVYDTSIRGNPLKEGAISSYSHIEGLLKALPSDPNNSVQTQAGNNFQAMLTKSSGFGFDVMNPDVAQPLDNALARDPSLQGKIVQLWKEHPDQLKDAIPAIKQNPQNAGAIVNEAYNRDYPASSPAATSTVASAKSPVAHSAAKTKAPAASKASTAAPVAVATTSVEAAADPAGSSATPPGTVVTGNPPVKATDTPQDSQTGSTESPSAKAIAARMTALTAFGKVLDGLSKIPGTLGEMASGVKNFLSENVPKMMGFVQNFLPALGLSSLADNKTSTNPVSDTASAKTEAKADATPPANTQTTADQKTTVAAAPIAKPSVTVGAVSNTTVASAAPAAKTPAPVAAHHTTAAAPATKLASAKTNAPATLPPDVQNIISMMDYKALRLNHPQLKTECMHVADAAHTPASNAPSNAPDHTVAAHAAVPGASSTSHVVMPYNDEAAKPAPAQVAVNKPPALDTKKLTASAKPDLSMMKGPSMGGMPG